MVKVIYFSLAFIFVFCTSKPSKTEEVLNKDLTKATLIIAEKNNGRLKKLKSYYEKDTSNVEMKKLYASFQSIHQFKNEYNVEINEGKDLVSASKTFIANCLGELTKEEQKVVMESVKESFIADEAFLEQNKNENFIKLELQLEAEMLVQEMDRLLVKDLKTTNNTFDWEIFWE